MINIDALNDDEKLAALESIHKSIAESKEIQKKKITTNVELIVKALKKIESDLKQRYDETGQLIANLKNGEDGRDGKDGKDGKNGRDGRDGPVGPRGFDGLPGRNGIDGTDGVSVTDAHIDFDGSLIISLSSGRVINVGEVVAADIAEKIKVITNGGGTSQGVLDAIASLQAQIDSIASGLEYQGTWNASTNVPTLTSSVGTAGYYYIVATAGSTNLNGVTDWQIGDWAVFNGSVWQKIDQTNLVTSVAGRTGAVVLSNTDISGLGTMSTQAANNVSITGGSITGITDLAIADGGTGASTAANARTNLGLVIGTDVLSPTGSAASLTSFPTFNQNTTGTAANVTGTVAIANGGTGATTAGAARTALGATTVGANVFTLTNPSAITFPRFNADNTVSALDAATFRTAIGAGTSSTTGTVTSVAASVPTFLSIAGSPITSSGTLAITLSGTALPTTSGGTGLTSFTANGVAYASSTSALATGSALTFDTARLSFIKASNSRAWSPDADDLLAIENSTSANFDMRTSTTGGSYVMFSDTDARARGYVAYLHGSDSMPFAAAGSEQMRLTSTGLGIGTSSPAAKLVVSNAGAAGYEINPTGGIGGGATVSTYNRSTSAYTSLTTYSSAMTWYNGSTRAMDLDASGNLGIGTSSPANKLTVAGATQYLSIFNTTVGTSASPSYSGIKFYGYLENSSGYIAAIEAGNSQSNDVSGILRFLTAPISGTPVERMRLDNSGNLGLGVTPSAWLSTYRSMQIGLTSAITGLTNDTKLFLNNNAYFNASSQWVYAATSPATQYQLHDGQHRWYNAPSGTAGNAITFTQAMTLDTSGNLMVGATSTQLGERVNVTGAGILVQSSAGSNRGLFGNFGSSDFVVGTYDSFALTFRTGNTERARIDSSGNLLIGSTSATGKLTVNIAASDGVYVDATSGTGYVYRTSNSSALAGYFVTSSGAAGSISLSGTTTAYNTSSDYRLKNITGPITNSGAYIDNLNPVEGTWKADGSTFVGLIAHEVQEASRTQVATGTKDGSEMQGMDYSNSELIANLIAEVKSLRLRVAQLEAQ